MSRQDEFSRAIAQYLDGHFEFFEPFFDFEIIVSDEEVIKWANYELEEITVFRNGSFGDIQLSDEDLYKYAVLQTILARFGGGINDVG